jgi:RHS repeat-associated protein
VGAEIALRKWRSDVDWAHTEHGCYVLAHDALNRLIEADYPNGPLHDQINASFAPNTFPFADDRYAYDPIGRAGAFAPHVAHRRADGQGWPSRRAKHGQRSNRLSSQSQPGPWAYNGNSELIQSPFGTTTFNLAGSTTEERTPTEQLSRRFAYDTEERPTEVTNAQGQRIARYYHDPFGRRLWKTLEPGAEGHSGGPAPETIYLAYNDEGYAAEFRLPGTPDTAPTQGPSSYSTLWVHEPDGLWSTGAIAIRIDGHWRYPQHDHLDTPRMLIDGQGAVTTTIRMNAFGETRHSGEAIANRFPGQVYDAETGLHYNYFRSYQPRTGRYTQADPIGVRGGINIFAYVASSPVLGLDVDGRVKWKGQSFTRAAAIYSVTDFTLHSECKCGVKWTVFVKARGVSLGRGYTWAGERNVELEDPFECPDPYALQGDYLDIGAGAAFAFGTEISFTWLGTAHSGGLGFSMLAGFATDAAITYGTSRVVGKIRQPCNKCE